MPVGVASEERDGAGVHPPGGAVDAGQAPAAGDVVEEPVLLVRCEVALAHDLAVGANQGAREPRAEETDVELLKPRGGEDLLVALELRLQAIGRVEKPADYLGALIEAVVLSRQNENSHPLPPLTGPSPGT